MRKCNNCGAKIRDDISYCEKCGNIVDNQVIDSILNNEMHIDEIEIDKADNNENYNQINNPGNYNSNNNQSNNYNNKPKNRNLFLTVLLWVLFLPIMIIITVVKNKNLSTRNKTIIISIVCIFTVVAAIAGGNNNSTSANTITSISFSKNDVWQKTGTTEDKILAELNCISNEKIKFVSTNTKVATIKAETNAYKSKHVYGDITILGNGETEIYAQTEDGKMVSNKVKYTVGNEYNPKQYVNDYIKNYVYGKLRYPEIKKQVLRSTTKHVYTTTRTYKSSIRINNITIDGNTAAVEGYADTYNASGTDTNCAFVIKVQYDEGITQLSILSEKYDLPEVINGLQ